MIVVKNSELKNCCLSIPGSKSYSHRSLIISALSISESVIQGILKCKDTNITCMVLKKIGLLLSRRGKNLFIEGVGEKYNLYNLPMFLGNSGTSMRLLSPFLTLILGSTTLVAEKEMYLRPMQDLIEVMNDMGLSINSIKNNGCPPIKIDSANFIKDVVRIDCSKSSQYLSSLLLISPLIKNGLKIFAVNGVVSRSYIDMTIKIMSDFGVFVERQGYDFFNISGGQFYKGTKYKIEPDCSHACYFWAAAALTNISITVKNLNLKSKQGDIKFLSILERMGSKVNEDNIGITVRGVFLNGITVNMIDMPDVIPILAVLAAFAKGVTIIRGICHLKGKESNRIYAITKELRRMKVYVFSDGKDLLIKGGGAKSAIIRTYKDHRIAMSFALAGLKISGVRIENPSCVDKSFPDFWKILKKLYI